VCADCRGVVRIGCSGWNYKHWREVVYPKGLPPAQWLAYYAELFGTVEINTTFYRLPTVKAVAGWVEQSPSDFLFAVKASRYLTHLKRLTDMGEPVRRLYERIDPLVRSPKLGPVLWQLPPNFPRSDERLEHALSNLPRGRHAFEFRHPTWFVNDTYDALRRAGVALVIGDDPRRPFQTRELTASFTFLRFHHGGGDGNYSHQQLSDWAQRIEEWRDQVDVYAYFNNDWSGFAVENGLWLKQRLGG
jgi:uncharacterized protein YecE (DUF72 family)